MEQEEQNKSPEPAQIQQADNTGLSVGLSERVWVRIEGCIGQKWGVLSCSKPFLSSS